LSIQPSNSVLSEKALNALKYAFLMNKKVGIGCLPIPELSPKIDELEKAQAAYEIARKLVAWSDQYMIESDTEASEDAQVRQNDVDFTQIKQETPASEEEHRSSLDLKNNDRMFPLQYDDQRCRDLKSLPVLHPSIGEVKDIKTLKSDSKDLDFPSIFVSSSNPDLKSEASNTPFEADVLISRSTDECDALDFFGAPTLDDLCEMNPLSDGDFASVRLDFGLTFDGQDKPRLFNDSDNCEDNLASPLSSPGSPCSPYSPCDILH